MQTVKIPDTISVHIAKVNADFALDLSALSDDNRARLVAYLVSHGLKQTLGDRVADPKLTGDEAVAAIEARLAKLQDGTFAEAGARGPRKNPIDAEVCNIVQAYLRKAGWKADAARKGTGTVDVAMKAFAAMIGERLKAKGKPYDTETVRAAFDANWPKVVSTAKANVDRAAAVGLDLD